MCKIISRPSSENSRKRLSARAQKPIKHYFCPMENFLTGIFEAQSYNPANFFLIAGPCVVEGEPLVMEVAGTVAAICKRLEIPYVFKASYRKANRTSAGSFTGIGDEAACNCYKKLAQPRVCPPPPIYMHTKKQHWQPVL